MKKHKQQRFYPKSNKEEQLWVAWIFIITAIIVGCMLFLYNTT